MASLELINMFGVYDPYISSAYLSLYQVYITILYIDYTLYRAV